MLFKRPTDEILYDALCGRDPAYDGFSYVCVTTTGIFCRFTCVARKPKRENCQFKDTVAACLEAGFRPCKRCKPMLGPGTSEPTVRMLLEALDAAPERRWRQQDLVALGHDLSTVRRMFKRQFGMSFLEIARLRRVGLAAETLAGGTSVIDAQLNAGFASGSGFRSAVTQLFGKAPARMRGDNLLKAAWIETPIGPMMAISDQHALHLLEFADRPALPNEIRRLETANRCAIVMGRSDPIDQIDRELGSYFAGESCDFFTRLAGHGTAFERHAWDVLRTIPPGTTRSYAQIAAAIGKPSAARAAARANGANQIAIVIPCHRVLAADGNLTGYGGGLWRKRWLLEHERRIINQTDVIARNGDGMHS